MRFSGMEKTEVPRLSVSDFIALTNQTLEYAYGSIEVEGEVAEFKVNQGKFVFFTLKDSDSSVGCFMMVFQLRIPIEDGMKVIVKAVPKLTKWGKFSLTIQQIRPSGEGSLKKGFELLRAKLEKEGLFSEERKRLLPSMPQHIAVISSPQAAGYKDFIKIVDARWGGMMIDVAPVQVQGEAAPDQIIRALTFINQQEILPEVIVILRGGGSADDLAVFNDEPLVRAVAASRVPVLTGIGHEVDESLVDQVADVRASTPSNAAERLVPEKSELVRYVRQSLRQIIGQTDQTVEVIQRDTQRQLRQALDRIDSSYQQSEQQLHHLTNIMSAFHPQRTLERGYALVRGDISTGSVLEIETAKQLIKTEVKDVRQK